MRGTKRITVTLAIGIIGISTPAQTAPSRERVIYGVDNRSEAANYPDARVRELSRSVAGRFRRADVSLVSGGISFRQQTLVDTRNVCSSEPFANEYSLAECTGFLVGDDTLVTAGHCVVNQSDCADHVWVFDYIQGHDSASRPTIFGCMAVLAQSRNILDDYAVIKLDHKVEGRKPLTLRTSGEIDTAADLLVIGHPLGLPLKITDEGSVRSVEKDKNFFTAELDTYGGNSGAPVINLATLQVEGVLIRGDHDFEMRADLSCQQSKVCPSGTCRGETVQKAASIPVSALEMQLVQR